MPDIADLKAAAEEAQRAEEKLLEQLAGLVTDAEQVDREFRALHARIIEVAEQVRAAHEESFKRQSEWLAAMCRKSPERQEAT